MSPRFSIILPTRNRVHLLSESLRTALAQDHDDFEVIVSNNASTDETRELLDAIEDPHLRVIHLDECMAMPAHWDFLLREAKGEFVRLLCDDDGLLPDCLSQADRFLRRHPEFDAAIQSKATYFHPQCPPGYEPNSLEISDDPYGVGRGGLEPDREKCFAEIASGYASMEVPTVLNSVVRRSCLDQIRSAAGKVFPYPTPDFGFAALFILTGYRWGIDPTVTWLWGKSQSSIGAMSLLGRGRIVDAFVKELGDEAPMDRAPVPAFFPPNYIAFAVRRACEHLGHPYEIDLPRHFVEIFEVLEECEKTIGFSVERPVVMKALRDQSEPQRTEIRALLRQHGFRGLSKVDAVWYMGKRAFQFSRHLMRRVLSSSQFLRGLRSKVRDRALAESHLCQIRGCDHAFATMSQAAAAYRSIDAVPPTCTSSHSRNTESVPS